MVGWWDGMGDIVARCQRMWGVSQAWVYGEHNKTELNGTQLEGSLQGITEWASCSSPGRLQYIVKELPKAYGEIELHSGPRPFAFSTPCRHKTPKTT